MRFFSFVSIIFLLLIVGCSKHNINDSSHSKTINPNDDPIESTPLQTDDSKPLTPSEDASESVPNFSNDDIASAKKVAEAYYKDTIHKVESMEYDLNNNLYSNYSSEYEKGNIITFTVKIKDSDNPPRGIALVRENSNSDWQVIVEGY